MTPSRPATVKNIYDYKNNKKTTGKKTNWILLKNSVKAVKTKATH